MIDCYPIVWTGDLSDDCKAIWSGFMLRAEWEDGRRWWWAVSVIETGAEIASSNSDPRECCSGDDARLFAESAAREYFLRHLRRTTFVKRKR